MPSLPATELLICTELETLEDQRWFSLLREQFKLRTVVAGTTPKPEVGGDVWALIMVLDLHRPAGSPELSELRKECAGLPQFIICDGPLRGPGRSPGGTALQLRPIQAQASLHQLLKDAADRFGSELFESVTHVVAELDNPADFACELGATLRRLSAFLGHGSSPLAEELAHLTLGAAEYVADVASEVSDSQVDDVAALRHWLEGWLELIRKGLRNEDTPEIRTNIQALTRPAEPSSEPSATSGRAFIFSEGVDDSILADFIEEKQRVLDELEEHFLSLEQFDQEKLHRIQRALHTLKGDAALLGMAEVEAVVHRLESYLTACPPAEISIDGLLAVRDWLEQAVLRCREAQYPDEDGLDLLARLGLTGNDEHASPEQLDDPPALSAANEAQPHTESPATPAARATLTLDLERIDKVVELIGELVIVEAMVNHAPEIARLATPATRSSLAQLSKIATDLQHMGMGMRMVPLRRTFQKMARSVRALGRSLGKPVELELSGESTEMDRNMVEKLADPLLHLVRNAVDHGIECSEDRRTAGKPMAGRIRLSAAHVGGSVVIEMHDDGRGLDREAILTRARQRGLVRGASELSDDEIDDLIFATGFSTAAKLTELSGRGVGLDVVRKNIESLRGHVRVSSTPGEGCCFRMTLPLTLAIIDGTMVRCGDERYILPTLSIVESIRINKNSIVTLAGKREVLSLRERTIPTLRLERLLDIPTADRPLENRYCVILECQGSLRALMVDDVVAQQQFVIKSFETPDASASELFSGATILADGSVGLILNVDRIAVNRAQPNPVPLELPTSA